MSKGMVRKVSFAAALVAASWGAGMAHAAVTEVEGSAGGGLVPWALMHPQGSRADAAAQAGSIAVTSISILAPSSTKPATCSAVMAGKCRPISSR